MGINRSVSAMAIRVSKPTDSEREAHPRAFAILATLNGLKVSPFCMNLAQLGLYLRFVSFYSWHSETDGRVG